MSDQQPSREDLQRLRRALDEVLTAARAESRAVNKAADECVGDAMREVHESHLVEINAIQTLVGSLELFERRLERRIGS